MDNNQIQLLAAEVARLKSIVLEVCEIACFHCEEYWSRKTCDKCRVKKIKQEVSDNG